MCRRIRIYWSTDANKLAPSLLKALDMTARRNMCFTFLTGCFGAVNTSTRNTDFVGNYNTVRHTECCFRAACKVSTNQRALGSCEVGLSVPPKLRGKGSWRCSQSTKESLASGCRVSDDQSAVRSGRQSDRMGISEAAMVGRELDREIIARRNSRRDEMMMKLNFCFFFCRRWWAFLLLQLHMLQALAQGKARDIFVYRNVASAFQEEGSFTRVKIYHFTLFLSEGNCRICRELISCRNSHSLCTILSWWSKDLQTVSACFLFSSSYPSSIPISHKESMAYQDRIYACIYFSLSVCFCVFLTQAAEELTAGCVCLKTLHWDKLLGEGDS